ncbi:MAG: hypothetical protein IJ240_00775 [Clostridia bacterium]|nr:hypothetical protein [Clostridia bacterium]
MTYFGKNGTAYPLEASPVNQGGEGAIYRIKGMPGMVAKLYHGPVPAQRAEKLTYMTELADADRVRFHSWPKDVLKDDSGNVVGLVMRYLSGVTEFSELLSADSDQLTWRQRVHIAVNLCDVVGEIHQMGQCIGDINERNFAVDMKTGYVYSFDTDSYHLRRRDNGRYYPCCGWTPGFHAPELEQRLNGRSLSQISPAESFTQNTDRFGLAILIFQLLMNGFHPFTGRAEAGKASEAWAGRDENSLLGKSPYFGTAPGLKTPAASPELNILPFEIRDALRRALLTEGRPDPAEWQRLLRSLEQSLRACADRPRHFFSAHLTACPWCAAQKQAVYQRRKKPAPQPAPQTASPLKGIAVPTKKQGGSWLLWVVLVAIASSALPNMAETLSKADFSEFLGYLIVCGVCALIPAVLLAKVRSRRFRLTQTQPSGDWIAAWKEKPDQHYALAVNGAWVKDRTRPGDRLALNGAGDYRVQLCVICAGSAVCVAEKNVSVP